MKLWLNKAQHAAQNFWALRDARERRLLTLTAIVIICVLYYVLLIAPALAGRTRLNKELLSLHQQVAQLQALSGEAAELSSKAATPLAKMSSETLNKLLATHGLQAKSVNVTGDAIQLRLENVSYSQTLSLLDELQQTARISVSAAEITALTQADMIDASVTLLQAGGQ
jgi:general secretion pathway protein M